MITGSGAVQREQSILFISLNAVWSPIGEDNESLSRTRNNTVTQTKNVLGGTRSTVAKGNQITTVDPFKITADSPLAAELYDIDRLSKQLDDVRRTFMEVSIFDEREGGKYAAWTQDGCIDLKSWGGQNDGLYAPFDVVWTGNRVYGVYDKALNTFTPTDSIKTLSVTSTAGGEPETTIITVTPSLGTGHHYRYSAGAAEATVTANQDLSAWTTMPVGVELTIPGVIITVAEVDASARAIKYGSATVVCGT